MKELLKKAFYKSYFPFSKINTSRFSDSFANLGYFIKSEALYNDLKVYKTPDRDVMHEELSTQFVKPGEKICFLEFGVYKGQSFAVWVKNNKNPDSAFAGFDTFTGIPENWGNEKSGSYSAKGVLPDIQDPRVNFHVGLIQDTLPDYKARLEKEVKKVIHIDVDLYNATLFTLIELQPFIRKGDIIIFDDFFTITKAAYEFRAFYDFLSLYPRKFQAIVKCRRGHLAIQIEE